MLESTNVLNRMVASLLAPLTDLLFDKHVDIMLEMAIFHLATWHKLTLEMARAQLDAALALESSVVDPLVEPDGPRIVQACALAHARMLPADMQQALDELAAKDEARRREAIVNGWKPSFSTTKRGDR